MWAVKRFFRATFAAMLACVAPATAHAQRHEITPPEWLEDISYMDRELRAHHPGLFRWTTETAFRAAVDSLKADVATTPSAVVPLRIARIVASLHDGHTVA